MLRAFFSCMFAALCSLCLPAGAAHISAYQHGVLIQGSIEPGDYARILAFVRHPDNYGRFARAVYLDSPGGDVLEAVRIANLLDKSYAATHVAPGARCYSACFMLWMSGVTRHVSTGATLGVHRMHVKVGEARVDPSTEPLIRIVRNVERYMALLGTPRSILDKMNATDPSGLFVISTRWLAEQQLLLALSYRHGFVDAAQARCGPEPMAMALKDGAARGDEEAERWFFQLKNWMSCADELRASQQRGDGVLIAALLAQ